MIEVTDAPTTREKLTQLMSIRQWYAGVFEPAAARSMKRYVLSGKNVSEKKMENMLYKLGYVPVPVKRIVDSVKWL